MPKILRKTFLIFILFLFPLFSQAAETDEELIRIGVLAKRGPKKTIERWSETANYLTNKIPGYKFEILPLDFDEVELAVVSKKADFILVNPSIYVNITYKYGVKRIATMKTVGIGDIEYTKSFGSVIFYKAEREDISCLEDISEKKLAAVEETSLGGWQMAWQKFRHFDIDPYKKAKNIDFLGTHDAVVYAVLNGEYDIGVVRTDTLEKMQKEGIINIEDFNIIYECKKENIAVVKEIEKFPYLTSTRLFPEWPISALKDTDDDLVEAVAGALLEMEPTGKAATTSNVYGWTVPQDYSPVSNLLKELKMPPFENYGNITFYGFIKQHIIQTTIFLILLSILIFLMFKFKNSSIKIALEKDRAQLYFDTASIMLVILNKKGIVTKINKEGLNILGYEKDEILGKNWFDVALPKDQKEKTKKIFNDLISGSIKFAEVEKGEIITKKGESKKISWKNNFLYDENSNIIGLISSGRDITKESEEKNKEDSDLDIQKKLNKALVNREIKMAELKKELDKYKNVTSII